MIKNNNSNLNKLEKLRKEIKFYKIFKEKDYSPKSISKEFIILQKVFQEDLPYDLTTINGIRELRTKILNMKAQNNKLYAITYRKEILLIVKKFLSWLGTQKGFKKYNNQSLLNELVLPKAYYRELCSYQSKINEKCTKDDFDKMYKSCNNTNIGKRNKTMLICLAYSGIRNSALKTLSIGAIKLENGLITIHQNPDDGVETKYTKIINSFIIPPNEEYYEVIKDYIDTLKNQFHFPNDAPLFGKLKPMKDKNGNFNKKLSTITDEYSKSNKFINTSLKSICKDAGFEKFYTVHSFRHFFAHYIKKYLKSAKEFEVIAKSLGHNGINLLFMRYGNVDNDERIYIAQDIQKNIWNKNSNSNNKINDLFECLDNIPNIQKEDKSYIEQTINLILKKTFYNNDNK